MSLKMGHVGQKTRSLGQILEKYCSLMLYHTIRKAQVSEYSAIMALLLAHHEHEVLMVSYWDSAVSGVRRASSVVNFLPCVCSRGHSFGRILMKIGQDVCLDEISDEFENGSCGVKN